MPKIGVGVQPGTYFTAREGDLTAKLTQPVRSTVQLGMRAAAASGHASKQGLTGTLAAGWAGHTVLHSSEGSESFSTGFSPDGDVPAARIALGPNGMLSPSSGSVLGASFGYVLSRLTGADPATSAVTGAVATASAVATVGTPNVPGAFHDETGVAHDPEAVALTADVGPGVCGAFQQMQRDLISTPRGRGTYSFRPDQRRTQNCVTAAVAELSAFVGTAQNHAAVMGEMQGGFRATGGALPSTMKGARAVEHSDNQGRERQSLQALESETAELRGIVDAARTRRTGNQGRVTAYLKSVGASRDGF